MQTDSQTNIFSIIQFFMPHLTKVGKRIGRRLLEEPREISGLSLAEFAKSCGCGQASIIRFCRDIGFEGYTEVKELVTEQYREKPAEEGALRLETQESVEALAQNTIHFYMNTLRLISELNPSERFGTAIEKIAESKNIYIFGSGDAIMPCLCAYYRFRRIGIHCFFDADADMQLINAANIREGDIALAISHSGKTRAINTAMQTAAEAGAYTIAITQSGKSPLAKSCRLLFFNAITDMSIGKTMIAHRLAEHAIIEIIYAGVVSMIPEQAVSRLEKSSSILQVNKLCEN